MKRLLLSLTVALLAGSAFADIQDPPMHDYTATRKLGRGTGGLMANNVSEAVAQQWGISPSTVRRRARRSMDALSSACTGTDGRVSA